MKGIHITESIYITTKVSKYSISDSDKLRNGKMDWTLSVLSNYFLAEKKTSKESNFIQTEVTKIYCPPSNNISIAKVNTFKRRLSRHTNIKDRTHLTLSYFTAEKKTSKESNFIQTEATNT